MKATALTESFILHFIFHRVLPATVKSTDMSQVVGVALFPSFKHFLFFAVISKSYSFLIPISITIAVSLFVQGVFKF